MFVVGSVFSIVFLLIFIAVTALIIFFIVRAVLQYSKNNSSPILAVNAVAVSKRASVSSYNNSVNGSMMYNTSTTYYITFEFETGSRQEFIVDGYVYGMIAEQDRGKLTFQGTRFLEFERF